MTAILAANQAIKDLHASQQGKPRDGEARAAGAINDAMTSLATFIPAEAMSLYLVVFAAHPDITTADGQKFAWIIYTIFVLLVAPGLFTLAFFSKLAQENARRPTVREIPVSRIVAAAIAFAVWGLCLPQFPVSTSIRPFTGSIAIFVSILLPAIDSIYNWNEREKAREKELAQLPINVQQPPQVVGAVTADD